MTCIRSDSMESKHNSGWSADPTLLNTDPTSYNKRMQEESLVARENEMRSAIAKLETKLSGTRQMDLPVTDLMDLMEETIRACGGESKLVFLEVSSEVIIAQTRVPLTANLFQFRPESDTNIRFHKVVTKLILQIWKVHGVRWIAGEDRSSTLIVSVKRNF